MATDQNNSAEARNSPTGGDLTIEDEIISSFELAFTSYYTVYCDEQASKAFVLSKVWCFMSCKTHRISKNRISKKRRIGYLPRYHVFRGFHLSTCYP